MSVRGTATLPSVTACRTAAVLASVWRGLLRAHCHGHAVEGKGPGRRSQGRRGSRLEGVAKAVGGRLLSVRNAVEAGTWRQGDGGWA